MKPTKFEINWWYIAFVLVAAAGGLGFIGWSITAQAYGEYRRSVPISGGFSWPLVVGIDLFCLGCFAALVLKVYRDAQTKFTSEAVMRPGLLGEQKIRWAEVTEVNVFNGVGYHIYGGGKRIVISPFAYKDPSAVVRAIRAKLEAARGTK